MSIYIYTSKCAFQCVGLLTKIRLYMHTYEFRACAIYVVHAAQRVFYVYHLFSEGVISEFAELQGSAFEGLGFHSGGL